jgi:hypothetical protein
MGCLRIRCGRVGGGSGHGLQLDSSCHCNAAHILDADLYSGDNQIGSVMVSSSEVIPVTG